MAEGVSQFDGQSPRDPLSDLALGRLFSRTFSLARELVRHEFHLAQIETQKKAKAAGLGLAVISAAAIVGFLGCVGLVATAVLALTLVIPPWAAMLVVAGGLLGAAGAVIIFGKEAIVRATPPIPMEAIENTKLDLKTIKERVTS